MIGLVDANNFYVSCERVFDGSLRGKPVAVLSNNDGCVISCSQEFKDLGIPRGTPYFQLADRKDLHFRSSNYALYGDISRRIVSILTGFAPDVLPYSIDESFIELSPAADTDWNALGAAIRKRLLRWVGIPCGVGFAPTRTLAKIANHIGKKRPTGVYTMPADPRPVLETVPVEDVWGVGRGLVDKVRRLGVRTAWDLARQDPARLQRLHGVGLARTALELRGTPALQREDFETVAKSVSASRSFGTPATTLQELVESASNHIAEAAEKLRGFHMRAAGANVYFQIFRARSDWTIAGLPGGTAATVTFPEPTDNTSAMLDALAPHFPGLFQEGQRYRKTGVVLFGLEPASVRRLALFDAPARPDHGGALYRAVDALNSRFGRRTVYPLAEGIDRPWQMKREFLSPSWTTSWSDIPRAH